MTQASRLTQMIEFLYERQQMHFSERWDSDPAIPTEFERRWPDATEAETARPREMAFEMFSADQGIKLRKQIDADELPRWRSDVH